mmetsp:Transcript_88077/g.228509  ORF Transcript_88077/g.228509 Transcript_88077/m.228509 type:complete len:281 (+) Transcript_88077:144-986(+)
MSNIVSRNQGKALYNTICLDLTQHFHNSLIERTENSKGCSNDQEDSLLVSRPVALALSDVKAFECRHHRCPVLVCVLFSQDESHIDVVDATSHHDVRENLDDAPQAIEVCRAVQDEEAAAPCQRDWQATQICLDIVLVDAEFVKPHARLTLMLGPKAPPPLLQGFPLRSRVVVPGVRDERIAMTELGGLCQSVKAWIRGIVLHILESQLGDVDTAEALPSLLQRLLGFRPADEACDGGCGACGPSHLHPAPQPGSHALQGLRPQHQVDHRKVRRQLCEPV